MREKQRTNPSPIQKNGRGIIGRGEKLTGLVSAIFTAIGVLMIVLE